MQLLSPLRFACGATAPNRLVFGPHETNLGRRRGLSERHTAYYRRRAAGGAGVIVTETASVHAEDHPYERAPLAADCAGGWAEVADTCHAEGALVLAGLGHTGQQGSSAYSQAPLWAPSRVPDAVSREVPMEMDADEIAEIVTAFATAARIAVRAGVDGVEVNAGQSSLLRQFLSGLTNRRGDGYGGEGRSRFAREVLGAVRAAVGEGAVLGLRLSCDELAPWAGITPEAAVPLAAELADAGALDYVAVVRGSIHSAGATRPDGHTPPGFNNGLTRLVRGGLAEPVAVCAQGSIVDPAMAEELVAEGTAQLVEMTRAQIADAELGAKLAAGVAERVRPCVLCNQTCQVRDPRNPIVSCIGDPRSGHETEDDPDPGALAGAGGPAAGHPVEVLVIGGGPAGLETARVAAAAGHRVRVVERRERTGGMLRVAAAGAGRERLALLADWLEAECERLGVTVETGYRASASDIDARLATGGSVVVCTGSVAGGREFRVGTGVSVHDAAEVLELSGQEGRIRLPDGPVAVHDPVGGPVAVSVAESLAAAGREVTLITPDHVAGTQLARTGDLAPAATRLAGAGVAVLKRSRLRAAAAGAVEVEHAFTGERREVAAGVLIDCGFRLPCEGLWRGARLGLSRAGDTVAPRTVHEAVLEGRRAALAIEEVYQ
ncbi:2,4-dienoyl-CoA reductase (NADPH2) [Spinactinospora alkalitolerans]|uniref:2,4-dienoyl-CoA reductase (NADPH2) n=1 Tax=Spinactinospora alkalitolerans TaxID=687207 RepID=A0A852TXJ2_9ACTN|nr:mycofactocin system FadH/OYE family oxidoreductase 1 [Spinactinospora alkalitolerans]NYE49226.1 2,4-dienoyl-CoA reductase (NADPH2) [Spinactinospora alkalitolerans]